MPRVALHTLGCKLNYAETGTLALDFEAQGFEVVPFGEPADLTVINTCSVTSEAERKCRQVVRRAVTTQPDSVVVVTGCYAQLRPEDLAAIEGVDLVLGTREKATLVGRALTLSKTERTQVEVSCIDDAAFVPGHAASDRARAFMKVQDGCDYSCSFCTIPRARGRSRSGRIADLAAEAERIADAGYREIVLSGVNIGLFGADTGESLLDLLRALDAIEPVARYRISSIEPNLLTDEIIAFVAASRAFQPHFHIPLQSGDDDVLGAMRRRYRRDVFADRVRAVAEAMPDAGIGADVIVGFPNETDERFENTLRFVHELPLSYLHVFTYSERPGTPAAAAPSAAVLPKAERSRRNAVLRLVSEQKRGAFARRQIGSKRSVLWEGVGADGRAEGFSDNYLRVTAQIGPLQPGHISEVTLAHLAADGSVEASAFALPILP